jgi:hypothetical protein
LQQHKTPRGQFAYEGQAGGVCPLSEDIQEHLSVAKTSETLPLDIQSLNHLAGGGLHQPPKVVVGLRDPNEAVVPEDNGRASCSLCGHSARSRDHVRRHVVSHHMEVQPQQCPVCFRPYKNIYQLNRHLNKVHKIYNTKTV